MKLAIYDFCGTLVDFQSGDEFLTEVLKATGRWNPLVAFLLFLGKVLGRHRKRLYLLFAWGIPEMIFEQVARDFYVAMIKPRIITQVTATFSEYFAAEFDVIVLSAGFSTYIKHFAEEHGGMLVLANELEFRNGKFTGRLKHPDCYGAEKVTRLDQNFSLSKIDRANSVFYTDSWSDSPIMKLVDNNFFVKSDGSIRTLS